MRRPLLSLLALMGVGAVGGLIPTLISPDTQSLWLIIAWAGWVATVIWIWTRPSFSLFLAVIMAEMLVLVMIPATGHIVEGKTMIAGDDFGAGTTRAIAITALAQWSMFAGAMLARTGSPTSPMARVHARLSATKLDHASFVVLGIGGIGLLLAVASGEVDFSRFLVFASQSGAASSASSGAGSTSGYFTAMQITGGLALALVALRFTSSTAPGPRVIPILMIGAATLLLVGTGTRGRYVVVLLAAGLVWLKTTKRDLPIRRLFVLALLAALVFIGAVGVTRGSGTRALSANSVIQTGIGGGELFAPLAGLAQTVPAQISYLNGSSYLETLVFPVPRALWPGKPTGKIAAVTRAFDPGNSGLAFPEFGEMYANFGFAGVVLGSLLFAFLLERLWIRLARSQSVSETMLVSLAFAVLSQLFARGDAAPELVNFLGLLLTTLVICRSGTLAPRRGGGPQRGMIAELPRVIT